MIPWFVVHALGWIGERFGYQSYVTATQGRWGADRLHFIRNPNGGRVRRLKPWDGTPLERIK
jgi:hypothetical protein